ncbi:translation elongation factor Ts [Candidatus Erwinia haradaeae]|uniref:Elongation factor Ts n=1 Tax=Candidatus Erwinia haradaeae TaxID=1922217 RepID=A0A451D9L8_9GAMM|nr:translation elongation factor Ts [Candidatus Erwinia haradaeae]VFP82949.1 Elongation factor Ts [Candidatus Erwinia haradaeae]
MINISVALVKDLRERTGSGIMDCKMALSEANGDIDLAIKNMRKSGMIKAAKKASHIAKEGVIRGKVRDTYGLIIEVNCETDFVAKNANFKLFTDKILNFAFVSQCSDTKVLESRFHEERMELITHFGENINIRRVSSIESTYVAQYLHGERIGVLVSTESSDIEFIKQIAMHIAASKPECIYPENISSAMIEREHQLQLEISMQSGKSKEIVDKMVQGRMQKFMRENSLVGQAFILDPEKTVGQCLKERNVSITKFIRFEVGEGLVNT